MFISPMLLHKSDHPFDDDFYITELKLDGIRILWTKFNDKVCIYTRHKNEVTAMYPELTNVDLPNGTVLDGEIVVSDVNGKPDFEACMERFKSKKVPYEVQYCVFDVIQYNGEKLSSMPLISRKKVLDEIVPSNHPNITVVQWTPGNGSAYFDLVKQNGLEGIVMKKADSAYEINKRSHSWLKVINYQFEDVYITGIRKDEFGLLLSFLDGKPAGSMEFMPPVERKKLYSIYQINYENDKFRFIEPIKCRVKYRNLTKQGKLRIPSLVEWL
ncbi:RNA ligase family protein [Metabacillus litoralis]|uniref:ATP-dependent DNA ligase n=1 Tax=Metabacillus litoralis TaxID=152268 RepID=A0A179SXU8_9BACI|nr:RNA ligase family protein [Metabacillus litoralis]OAS85113.1 ATP-dependent DNA ligase [Metabacillus litoralis]